jgi:hypothetical protein
MYLERTGGTVDFVRTTGHEKVNDMTTKEQKILKSASDIALSAESWADLSNALFDPEEGLVAKAHPTREQREQFVKTNEYRAIRQLIDSAAERTGFIEGATQNNLFVREPFISHSGIKLDWKINCDALTDEDLDCLAWIITEHFSPIREVVSIPSGGDRLAQALQCYLSHQKDGHTLIIDDVLTTGGSMDAAREFHPDARGVVIFARGICPDWVWPVFQMS